MSKIIVYNRTKEDHCSNKYNFPIYRPTILGNPYTHIKDKCTKATYIVNTREEAIQKFSDYFDIMYGNNIPFTKAIDEIYNAYKNGNDIYLECYCGEGRCHGDVIAKKIKSRFIKEKLKLKNEQNFI